MENILYSILGILIPFVGTTFGSSFVFFMKNKINNKFQKFLIGFAAGVMIAAAIWSLIMPSIEMAKTLNIISWLPASIGLILGIIFLLLINIISNYYENKKNQKKINMLLFSVTLHNIPEGMAVGVCFAGFLLKNTNITLLASMIFSLGIAIQNLPEGAIISMPLKMHGMSKSKSFLYGVLSGIVEPIAAILTLLLSKIIVPLLPYLLSFAAGAMIYVVVEELIPEMHADKKSYCGIIGISIGFMIMMILDIALG